MDISLTVAVRYPYLYRQTDTHNAIAALSEPTLLYHKNPLRPPKPRISYHNILKIHYISAKSRTRNFASSTIAKTS